MFSSNAKDEIAGVRIGRGCCACAFVSSLATFAKVSRAGSYPAIVLSSKQASVARAAIAAAHLAGSQAHATRSLGRRTGKRWPVTLRLPQATSSKFPRKHCCRRAWLRAAFLACGSVSDPARGYHLEFFCRGDNAARLVCEAIAGFGADAGMTRRRGRPLAYVKDAQTVSALLGYMGANDAVLRLEAQRALAQTKNSIRRTVNSEAANAARAAASAARQQKAARRAIARVGFANLTPALREAAQLRMTYPARTLRELARSARPPITKAAMASRLRLLERLGDR